MNRSLGDWRIGSAALVVWFAWRCWTLATMPSMPDPREALLVEEARRVQSGRPPTLFHWPGVPWTFLVAGATAALRIDREEAVVSVMRFGALGFAAACLVLTYLIARRVTVMSLMPPVLLAASPAFSTGESNVGLVDFPSLAFALCAVWIVASDRWRPLVRFAAAGAMVGVGAAFKLPAVLCLAPIVYVILDSRPSLSFAALCVGVLLLGVGVGFLFGCPFALTEFPAVIEGLGYELDHYHKGHFGLFPTAGDSLPSATLRHIGAFGWAAGPLTATFGALPTGVVIWRWREWRREDRALLLWLAATVGAVAIHKFSFSRHWLTVLPPFALLASFGLERLRNGSKRVAFAALAVAALHSAATTAAIDAMMRRPSTIEACDEWIRAEALDLGVSRGPTRPVFAWLYPSSGDEIEDAGIVIVAAKERDLRVSAARRPQVYLETDFFPLSREDLASGGDFYDRLESSGEYEGVKRFAVDPPAWVRGALFFGRDLPFPLDALFHPELLAYRRRSTLDP